MTNTIIYTTASRKSILEALTKIAPEACSGNPESQEMLNNAGIVLLYKIHDAFVIKSKDGTDEAGERWAPLSPYTINIRRRKKQKKQKEESSSHPSVRRIHSILKGDKRTNIKGKGSNIPTFDKYADSVNTDILVDTGALLKSLTPFSGSELQVFNTDNGKLEIGTTREGASDHHTGDPKRRLPQRKLWPSISDWPTHWWGDILVEIRDGITDLAVKLVREAK